MSLLTVCQDVADAVGGARPSTVVGNTTRHARLLFWAAQRASNALAKEHNWTILQYEHTFNTAASTASYTLVLDPTFDRLMYRTTWDRANYRRYRASLSPQEWQRINSGLVENTALSKGYRLKAESRVNKFFIEPTPTAVEAQVFEYITNEHITDSGNTAGQTAYLADTDVTLLNEELVTLGAIWRVLRRLGLAYADERDEYERFREREWARDGGTKELDLGARREVISAVNIEEGSFNL